MPCCAVCACSSASIFFHICKSKLAISLDTVQAVLRTHNASLQCMFRKKTGREHGHVTKGQNIGDFFVSLKDYGLVSTTLSVAKLTHIFFISNFETEQETGWDDWNWEMVFDEFCEVRMHRDNRIGVTMEGHMVDMLMDLCIGMCTCMCSGCCAHISALCASKNRGP